MGCILTKTADLTEEEKEDKLKNIELKDIRQFSFEGIKTKAKVLDVYDGDTIRVAFYYKEEIVQLSCRMLGYDSPEMKISNNNPDRLKFKQMGMKARDKLKTFLQNDTKLVLIHLGKNDMYGRPLIDVYVNNENINTKMISEGYGKAYDGGKKTEWTMDDYSKFFE
jgi:endonuclease YncB( thermonuclease family)